MTKLLRGPLALGALIISVLAASAVDDGFEALFNGRDFTGWRFSLQKTGDPLPENWKVKDGVIIATVKSTTAGGGTPPYGDSFVRILTKQTGNAIESLRIIEDGPRLPSAAVTARYEAKQDAIFTTLVSRYHD